MYRHPRFHRKDRTPSWPNPPRLRCPVGFPVLTPELGSSPHGRALTFHTVPHSQMAISLWYAYRFISGVHPAFLVGPMHRALQLAQSSPCTTSGTAATVCFLPARFSVSTPPAQTSERSRRIPSSRGGGGGGASPTAGGSPPCPTRILLGGTGRPPRACGAPALVREGRSSSRRRRRDAEGEIGSASVRRREQGVHCVVAVGYVAPRARRQHAHHPVQSRSPAPSPTELALVGSGSGPLRRRRWRSPGCRRWRLLPWEPSTAAAGDKGYGAAFGMLLPLLTLGSWGKRER